MFTHTLISDCRTPASQGYNFTFTDTTYESAASVTCATGYEGTPNPGNVACLDTGYWETVTGCERKGMVYINLLILSRSVFDHHPKCGCVARFRIYSKGQNIWGGPLELFTSNR